MAALLVGVAFTAPTEPVVEGAKVATLVVPGCVTVELLESLTLSSFFWVTIHHDCQSHHGVQSKPTNGFQS